MAENQINFACYLFNTVKETFAKKILGQTWDLNFQFNNKKIILYIALVC